MPQQLLRVIAHHLFYILRIILAAQHQKKAALLQAEQASLKIPVGAAGIILTQRDTVDTIFPYHTTPEGIVCIQRDHLGLSQVQAGSNASDCVGQAVATP